MWIISEIHKYVMNSKLFNCVRWWRHYAINWIPYMMEILIVRQQKYNGKYVRME